MIGLDCNILVQLALADHPAHAQTLAALKAETERGEKLVFPLQIVTEFLHVITDARRFAPPLSMTEALDWIVEFLKNPAVGLIEPNEATTKQTLLWMKQFNLGRKRILDTHFAAMLHTNGVRRLLTSNPADFALFGVLETVAP